MSPPSILLHQNKKNLPFLEGFTRLTESSSDESGIVVGDGGADR